MTALQVACLSGHLDVAKRLLDAGADVTTDFVCMAFVLGLFY